MTVKKSCGFESHHRHHFVSVNFVSISSHNFMLSRRNDGLMLRRVPEHGLGWLTDSCYEKTDAMRILLQHARTQLYLRSLGNWTANPIEAHDFQHSQRANDFAREHGIAGVQIAVKFVDHLFKDVFPLSVLPESGLHTKGR